MLGDTCVAVHPSDSRYTKLIGKKVLLPIVNREIDVIPKKEYWGQMQLQMENCDLDECDFLETKFVEYDNFIMNC